MERSPQSFIEYARQAHALLNKRLFDGKLQEPEICFWDFEAEGHGEVMGMYLPNPCPPVLTVKPCAILFSHLVLDVVEEQETTEAQNEKIVDTLLHEMIHQYCNENGIKDFDRANGLHLEAFADAAEAHGLMCLSRETEHGITYGLTFMNPDYDELWEELNA